jgi:hypothetical protein
MNIRLSISALKSASEKIYHVGQALNKLQASPLAAEQFSVQYGHQALEQAIFSVKKEKKATSSHEKSKDSSLDLVTIDSEKDFTSISLEDASDDILLPSLSEYIISTKTKRKKTPVLESKKNSVGDQESADSEHSNFGKAFLNCEMLVFKKLFDATISQGSNKKNPEANILRSITTLTNDLTEEEMEEVITTMVEDLKDLTGREVDKRVFAIKAAIALLSFSKVSNLHLKASSKQEEKKQEHPKQMIPQKMLLPFLQVAAGENISINSDKNILDLAIQYYSFKPELNPNEETGEEQESDLAIYYKSFLEMLFKSYVNSTKPFNYGLYGFAFDLKSDSHGALIHFGQAFLKLGRLDKNKSLFTAVINTFIEEMDRNPVTQETNSESKSTPSGDIEHDEFISQQKIADMFLSPLLAKIIKYDNTVMESKTSTESNPRGGDIYRNPKYIFLNDFRTKILNCLRPGGDQKSLFAVIEAISAIDEFYMKAMSAPNRNDPLEKYHKKAIEKCEAVYPPSVRDKVTKRTTILKVVVATLAVALVAATFVALLVYAAPLIPVVGAYMVMSLKPALGIGFLAGASVGKMVYDKMTGYMTKKSSFHTRSSKSAFSFFNEAKKIHDDKLPKEAPKSTGLAFAEGADFLLNGSILNNAVSLDGGKK